MTEAVTPPATPGRVKFVCPVCKSDRILRDAYATWNQDTQEWELHSVYDYSTCQDCDTSGNHRDEIPI